MAENMAEFVYLKKRNLIKYACLDIEGGLAIVLPIIKRTRILVFDLPPSVSRLSTQIFQLLTSDSRPLNCVHKSLLYLIENNQSKKS